MLNQGNIPMQGDDFISSLNLSTRQQTNISRRNKMLIGPRVDKIKMTNEAQKVIQKLKYNY